jgi:flavin reductase (DIM6/NTAB) family NADH-FMN oxidoreductase RutF
MFIGQDRLRMVMRKWASGVTIVTTKYEDKFHGMTVSSFTSVSLEPPLVTISLMKDSRTHKLILQSTIFGITILSEDQVEISSIFAGQIPDSDNRFSGVQTTSLQTGAPMIKDGLAFFDCHLFDTLEFGTNSLLIGEVIAAELGKSGKPLLYFDQRYRKLQD